jgi:DNA-binding ferritin-like protein
MDFASEYRSRRLARATTEGPQEKTLDQHVAMVVSKLMNAAVSFHKLHLKVKGAGSYAAHKALNEIYDALPGHADDLAEGFQGATEMLLSYEETEQKVLNSVEEAVSYIRELYKCVNDLQAVMPYTEIVNDLDNVKSQLNSTKYKLVFLS